MAKYRVPVLGHFCWQEPVKSFAVTEPEAPHTKGDRFIIDQDWTNGQAGAEKNNIAWWDGSAWQYDPPEQGWKIYDLATESFYTYDESELSWKKDQLSTLVLGNPTDGQFTDGLLEFTNETIAVDAIDVMNEVLKDVAPPNAESLTGKDLVDNVSFVTGKLPTGLADDYYAGGNVAGTTINFIVSNPTVVLSSPDQNKCFNWGDQGLLKVEHEDGASGGAVDVVIIDVGTNFKDVGDPGVGNTRLETQDLTTWDEDYNDGSTNFPCENAIAPFVATKTSAVGNLQITSCGGYKGEDGTTPIFNMWQKMNAQINITTLPAGYNAFKLIHDLDTDQETNEYKIWHDDNNDNLAFSVAPTISLNTLNSNKYISGVQYYSTGDTFDVAFTGANLFKNCYRSDLIARHKFEARAANTDHAPPASPAVGDTFAVSDTIVIDRGSYYDLDTRLTANLYHPWKPSINAQTPSQNIMVCTYGNVSTDTVEYFRDENHRLDPTLDYDSVPASITGQWDSTNALGTNDALVYNQRVQYPNINLTGMLPAGPNYTGKTGDQVYCRAFYKNESNLSADITLGGISVGDIDPVGTGDLNVEIKLPGISVWLDAGSPYPEPFLGATGNSDGCGCQLGSSSGNLLKVAFGTLSTINSGGMIIVKVTFRTSAHSITSMSVAW